MRRVEQAQAQSSVSWVAEQAGERGWTRDEVEVISRMLSRVCPTCHAEPGHWCRTAAGHLLDDIDKQHVARRAVGKWRTIHNA